MFILQLYICMYAYAYIHTYIYNAGEAGQGCGDSLPRQLLFLCEQEFDLLTRLWGTLHTVDTHTHTATVTYVQQVHSTHTHTRTECKNRMRGN